MAVHEYFMAFCAVLPVSELDGHNGAERPGVADPQCGHSAEIHPEILGGIIRRVFHIGVHGPSAARMIEGNGTVYHSYLN